MRFLDNSVFSHIYRYFMLEKSNLDLNISDSCSVLFTKYFTQPPDQSKEDLIQYKNLRFLFLVQKECCEYPNISVVKDITLCVRDTYSKFEIYIYMHTLHTHMVKRQPESYL